MAYRNKGLIFIDLFRIRISPAPCASARRGHALWLIQRHSARLSLAADAFLADLEKTLRAREAAPDPTRYDEDAAGQ